MKRWVILGMVVMTGCVRKSEVNTPSGGRGFALDCPNAARCYEEAGELCPNGYNVVDGGQEVQQNPLGGMSESANDDYVVRSKLIVECR